MSARRAALRAADPSDPLPPSDEAAEQVVIGSCLVSPTALEEVAGVLSAEDFYVPGNGELYAAFLQMRELGRQVDHVTLIHHLGVPRLERLGGAPYLFACIQAVPTASNVLRWAEQIRENAQRRRLMEVGTRLAALARKPGDFPEVLAAAEEAYQQFADAASGSVNAGRRIAWTAAELVSARFPEPRWAVPNLIPMGLTLIAGPPKVGKSWLLLGLSLAIANGQKALDYQEVEPGPVLYLALEDSPARLQNRLEDLADDRAPSADLHFWTEAERGPAGIAAVERWLLDHPTARLVVVDVLQKFRRTSNGDDRYAADYDAMSPLKRLADAHGVAVVAVHHTRKSADGDFLQEVSGSNGIAGSADTVMVLRRGRTESTATLAITGRDVAEEEHTLQLDGCRWTMVSGPARFTAMAPTRVAIFNALRSLGTPSRPVDVAPLVSASRDSVRKTLHRMADDEQVVTDGRGRYWVPAEYGQVRDTGTRLGREWDSAENSVSPGHRVAGTAGTPDEDLGPVAVTAELEQLSLSQSPSTAPDQGGHGSSQVSQSCPIAVPASQNDDSESAGEDM